eukprot:COSAG05_NODE_4628_length_1433_cov_0.902549_1_plen_477_part_11
MNILLGGTPLGEDGWWDGYEVGRYEYELGKEEKRVKPQLDALLAQKAKLEAKVAAAGSESVGVQAKPLVSFGPPEAWTDAPCKFTRIEASYTRLILLGDNGLLYSWHWAVASQQQRSEPQRASNGSITLLRGLHPRALGIKAVASCALRTSVLTNTGKIASWMDDICHSEAQRAAWADPLDQGGMAQLAAMIHAELTRGYTCDTIEKQRKLMRIAYLEHGQRQRRDNIKRMQQLVDELHSSLGRMTNTRRRHIAAKGPPRKRRPLPVEALEHRATDFSAHHTDRISKAKSWVSLAVSDKGTVALASDNGLYWWGACPPPLKIKKKNANAPEPKLEESSEESRRFGEPSSSSSSSYAPPLRERLSPFGSSPFGRPSSDKPAFTFRGSSGSGAPGSSPERPSELQSSWASSALLSSSSRASTAIPETFEAAYSMYAESFGESSRSEAFSKQEIVPLLCGDKFRSILMKGVDSSSGKGVA